MFIVFISSYCFLNFLLVLSPFRLGPLGLSFSSWFLCCLGSCMVLWFAHGLLMFGLISCWWAFVTGSFAVVVLVLLCCVLALFLYCTLYICQSTLWTPVFKSAIQVIHIIIIIIIISSSSCSSSSIVWCGYKPTVTTFWKVSDLIKSEKISVSPEALDWQRDTALLRASHVFLALLHLLSCILMFSVPA